jgi:hypothetical protein
LLTLVPAHDHHPETWHVSTLPAPLARATLDYLEEERVYSADELSSLIEAWLKHLGWLWVADYLHSKHQHEVLNRLLYQMFLLGTRNPSVGTWAYIGSTFSRCYAQEGWGCQIPGMNQLDYGAPDDHHSPLSRLLHFRNHFAHGSFEAIVADILLHQELLWHWLEPLQGFQDCPILFFDDVEKQWKHADLEWKACSLSIPEGTSGTILLTPENHCLPLSSVIFLKPGKNKKRGWKWSYFYVAHASADDKQALLFQNPHVRRSLEALEQQRAGALELGDIWERARLPSVDASLLTEWVHWIRLGLQTNRSRPNLILILGYPGSGKTGFLSQSKVLFPEFQHVLLYQIQRGEITASASTFVRFLLRQLAQEFAQPEWEELAESTSSPLEALKTTLMSLQERGERLLIGIDNIHLGYEPAWGDRESLASVLTALEGIESQHLSFLLTARPGYQEGLYRDTLLELPPDIGRDINDYEKYLRELHLTEDLASQRWPRQELLLRRLLLFLLGCSPSPLTVFDLCVALERLQERLDELPLHEAPFTPHIERALWEMRPLLRIENHRDHEQAYKTYAPFSPNFAQWLLRHPPF